ncbi:hypothetical protein SDJN03_22530, partial [Cucurbita argyrosperma subsp. sororia]
MDITVPGGNDPEEVTRESLIAISYEEPETTLSSKRSSGKLSSENLNLVNGIDHNLVEGKEYDVEKYRSELIAISFLESPPEIGSGTVTELKVTIFSSKQSSGKLGSENLNLVNEIDHNLVKGKEYNDDKYRSELTAISFLESPPEIGSGTVAEHKG